MALVFLSLAHISVRGHISYIEPEISALSRAVQSIASMYFFEKFSNVRIMSSFDEEKRTETYDFVSKMIEHFDSYLKVTIEEPKVVKYSEKKRGSPLIIVVQSVESFERIEKTLEYDNVRFRKYYLLILVNGLFAEMERVSKAFWDNWIYNVNVLVLEVDGNVGMYTFYPFANEHCGNDSTLYFINKYHPNNFSWSSEVFFDDKFKNLNKCKFKVAALDTSTPSVIVSSSENGTKKFSGLEVDIVNKVAEEFNLTAVFDGNDAVGNIFPNGSTVAGVLASVHIKTHDLAIGTLSLQFERVQFLSETVPVLSVPIIVVIPPAKLISPFKKLLRPFSILVWILMASTFLLGIAVVTVFKLTSQTGYSFIVGKNVNYPILNMLIAFFGGSQNKLPNLNFARYLLMKFLLFCLVIRCLYQGKLFIMLQMELRDDQVETVDDIVERDMIFYAYESFARRVQQFSFANR